MKIEAKVKIILENGMEINLEEAEARALYYELKKMFGNNEGSLPFYPLGTRGIETNKEGTSGQPYKPYITYTSDNTGPFLINEVIRTNFKECEIL